ncbi:MAG: hypothetical protein PHF56_24295 [Desulfuromonadaceae bacterium]|nr:hypothetical protein [Desulfuromonadaceae bacterium]
MSLNANIQQIVGKKIQSVIVKHKDQRINRDLLYLVFSDGTGMEIYGEDVNNARDLSSSGLTIAKHIMKPDGPTFEFHCEE